ncbi:hypothetical protein HCA60_11005 [Listeria booriae]|uniref:hypothetical protein n=1 Tax=Listeria booriae TaxID=1552123 RepID=UPI001629AE33|nr:hypothetical protein [Listeria booriae]MBC1813013.1 hypothetical protein [Listeria booriae]
MLAESLKDVSAETLYQPRGVIGVSLKIIKAFGWVCRLGGAALSRALRGVAPQTAYVIRKYSRLINKGTEKLNSVSKGAIVSALRSVGIPKKESEIIAEFLLWII